MKKTVAKLFCFLTVLLLSSNVLLAFGHYHNHQVESKSSVISRRNVEYQINKLTDNESRISFLAENDTFEDFELLADVPISYSFDFGTFSLKSRSIHEFNSYNFSGYKIPRWLWIRHIII